MHKEVTGDRYILYLPQSKENYDRLDGSLAQSIESELEKFLMAFNPESIFDQSITDILSEVKNDRSVVRAFASWWDGGDIHVLLVLAVYKKAKEDDFWDDVDEYHSLAKEYRDELVERQDKGDLRESLSRLEDNDEFRVLTQG